MKNDFRKLITMMLNIVLCMGLLNSCTFRDAADVQEQDTAISIAVGDVIDGWTVVAIGHDKYVLFETIDEEGCPTWDLEGGDLGRSVTTFYSGDPKFITFTEDYFLYMTSNRNSPDELFLHSAGLEPIQGEATGESCGRIPVDPFTIFPVIERVRYEENEAWMELRYHVSESELSEETVIYHVNLWRGSLGEVESFEV